MKKLLLIILSSCSITLLSAQDIQNNPTSNHGNKFEALGTILPSPNEYRTASGAPGPKYWQQRCDYDITCNLDEDKLLLTGSETITYFNNSPNELTYLWMQLDENEHSSKYNAITRTAAPFRESSATRLSAASPAPPKPTTMAIISSKSRMPSAHPSTTPSIKR